MLRNRLSARTTVAARLARALAFPALCLVAAACAPSSGGAAPVTRSAGGEPAAASPVAARPAASAAAPEVPVSPKPEMPGTPAPATAPAKTEIATFAGGCYWCIEAVFEQIPGVLDAKSGFLGGHVESPSYEAVCDGTTGHAEAVQLTFDPSKVTFGKLVEVFWEAHDPTTLNRQGADVGTQYRSAIFYHSDEQRRVAEESKAKLAATLEDPVVTEIVPAAKWYDAPKYHQDYYVNNREQGYCRVVIRPKLKKLGLKE